MIDCWSVLSIVVFRENIERPCVYLYSFVRIFVCRESFSVAINRSSNMMERGNTITVLDQEKNEETCWDTAGGQVLFAFCMCQKLHRQQLKRDFPDLQILCC